MAKNRKNDFSGAAGSARGEDTGIFPSAVEIFGGRGNTSKPAGPRPKVVDPDRPNIFDDGTVIDERELARSRGSFVAGGGRLSEDSGVPRVITAPQGEGKAGQSSSKEILGKLQEHHAVLSSFAATHEGAITTARRTIPGASRSHGNATMALATSSQYLAEAKNAISNRNTSQANKHLRTVASALVKAHSHLNSSDVREVTGSPVPIHIDELKAWKNQTKKENVRVFRTQGKPEPFVQVGGETKINKKTGKVSGGAKLRTDAPLTQELAKKVKGTILGDKIDLAVKGTPRTSKPEREATSAPTRGEKGTGVIDTRTRGTRSGRAPGESPTTKSSKTSRVDVNLRKANLAKIGDTSKRVKPETSSETNYRTGTTPQQRNPS
jgi:hypothetical protein